MPNPHGLHRAPPEPQVLAFCIPLGTHLPWSQQPPKQLEAVHTGNELHAPLTHVSPAAHARQTLPLLPQLVAV